MVRSKHAEAGTVLAEPGTREFQQQTAQSDARKPLSESQISHLEEERKDLQRVIEESGDRDRAKGVDLQAVQARIRHIDKELLERSVPEASGAMKDKLVREERDIEDKLVVGMPSRYEMDHPNKRPGAVRKHLAWLGRNDKLIRRYVEIQRILRPEEPKSIEELRKAE